MLRTSRPDEPVAFPAAGDAGIGSTQAQKMETCKFGADDQKLDGAKRKAFMAKCMSNRDDKRPDELSQKRAPLRACARR